MGHLNGRQLTNLDWSTVVFLLFYKLIVQLHDTPDTATEEAVIFLWILICQGDIAHTQVRKFRNIGVPSHIQPGGNHINDGMAAMAAQFGENLLSLIWPNKIIRQNTLDTLNSLFDNLFIIGATVLAKQEFKDIYWDISPFFNFLCQVLANNLPIKIYTKLVLYDFAGIPTRFEYLHTAASPYRN